MLHQIDFGRLKINKNYVKKQERGTINTFYKKNRKFVVIVSDNGPVTVIYNIKKYVPHASIKWLNSGTKLTSNLIAWTVSPNITSTWVECTV